MVISTPMTPVPEIPPFNLAHDPLDGRSLIEASAGTGKTYTIAGLFIRLIIEKRLQPGQILVVTFTQAATEELRSRVRRAIREALDAFTTGATDDPFFQQLLARYKDRDETAALLVTALRCFDEAAVHTIHGFCQRMLEENAFESGSLFDTELESDDACLREIVQDFWRLRFHNAPDEIAACAAGKFAPDVLLSFVKKSLPAQNFKLLPDHQGSEPPSMGECLTAFRHVQEAWQDCRNEVADILVHNPGLKRTTYRADSIPGWIEAMDGYLDGGLPLEMFEKFSNFCQVKIKDSTKKGHEPPCHSFFDLCEALFEVRSCAAAALDRYLLFLRGELVAYIRRETPRRRSLRNTRSFDDILTDFHAALHGEQQELLVAAVREKFPVALIDEFQDTDPVQYGIFRRIYGSQESVLFLIGDPKQAIYSFRGADVFAYFRASRDVDRRYTLGHNWRSAPRLVAGVNALFAGASDPFVFTEIQFHPVAAGLTGESEEEPPLRFWFIPREGDDPISAVAASDLIAAAVADEIVRVIDHKEVTHPGEIAVLVRSNHQAQLMARILASRRVPSVVCNAGTVFQSVSASELLHFLAALLDPADEGLVRRALVTDMFGLSASQLHAEAEDEEQWLAWLEKFHRWREAWERSGIIVMARSVLAGEGIRARLLRLPDGERRLTDLLQCIELLQQAEHDENLGMDRLFEWLRRRIVERREQEEYLVRLETDESAVKIVTIHKSKGLEYEVVFCPFCWSGSREKKDTVVFHDRSDGGVIVDMGSDDIEDSRALAEEENLAENLRLLYVAVTRARRRCYVAWGGIRDAGTSSLAYLFHGKEMFGCGEKIPLPDDLLLERLFALRDAAPEAVSVSVLPTVGEPVRLSYDPKEHGSGYSCAVFRGKISHDWRISSFSSLIRGAGKEAELPDRDHLHSVEESGGRVEAVEALEGSIFSFPRGATAGTFLHEVFERVDFQGGESCWRDVIGRGLRKNGYSPEWEECVAGMVAEVLGAELATSASRFRLADIVSSERLHEMEFHLPVAGLATDKLAAAFLKYGSSGHLADTFKRLAFEPVKGYLKGFIDLVFRHDGRFYLLDWKSNHLGNALADYEPAILHSVMERELYFLQAHLYTVALHRYLSLRVPGYSYESHFGGVFYLFIRGIRRSAPGSAGVYHTCPDIRLVEGLSGLFRGDEL